MFTKKYLIDLVERVIATAAQAGIAVLAMDVSLEKGLTGVGVAALAALLKGLAASQFGAKNTAAMLPAGPDTEKG